MADNPYTKLPIAGQLGVAVSLLVLIAGGFYYFLWSDMDIQEKQRSAELAALQSDIRSLEVTANKLQEFQREVALREAKLETLKRILPADKETPELMKKVQYLAAQSNLIIRKFTPGATVRKEFPLEGEAPVKPGAAKPPASNEYYQEWPINVDVEGTYHNLGLFFDRVGRLSRLVNVGGLNVKANSTPRPSNTINVSCVATTFVYVEAPPVPAKAPGGAK